MLTAAVLLVIVQLLGMIGLVIVVLELQRRGRKQADRAGRKRKNEDAPIDSCPIRLEDQSAISLAEDELPELSEDDLFLNEEKPKRSEDRID